MSLRYMGSMLVDGVQDAVDELAGFGVAEPLGQLDGLVDADFWGDPFLMQQLEGPEPQDVPVNHRHALDVPVVRMAGDDGVDVGQMRHRAAEQLVRESLDLPGGLGLPPEPLQYLLGVRPADVRLVQHLQRIFPGFRAVSHRGCGSKRSNNPSTDSAASAASSPRWVRPPPACRAAPRFPLRGAGRPARARAWAGVSATTGPKGTGMRRGAAPRGSRS